MFDKILTLCTGNICRSPLAEFLLRDRLAARGAYYPPVPSYDAAFLGGTIATNAAGPATFSVQYIDTDVKKTGVKAVDTLYDPTVVFTLGVAF